MFHNADHHAEKKTKELEVDCSSRSSDFEGLSLASLPRPLLSALIPKGI